MKALEIYKVENYIYIYIYIYINKRYGGGGALSLVKQKVYKNIKQLVNNLQKKRCCYWEKQNTCGSNQKKSVFERELFCFWKKCATKILPYCYHIDPCYNKF